MNNFRVPWSGLKEMKSINTSKEDESNRFYCITIDSDITYEITSPSWFHLQGLVPCLWSWVGQYPYVILPDVTDEIWSTKQSMPSVTVNIWNMCMIEWIFFSLDRFSYCSPALRPIHTKPKSKRKRKFCLMFVFNSPIFFACSLILLAFAPTFAWCELLIWNSNENVEYAPTKVVVWKHHYVLSIWQTRGSMETDFGKGLKQYFVRVHLSTSNLEILIGLAELRLLLYCCGWRRVSGEISLLRCQFIWVDSFQEMFLSWMCRENLQIQENPWFSF